MKFKKLLILLLSFVLIGVNFYAITKTYRQSHWSGEWSSVCNLTNADKEWIKERYSENETVEELLYSISNDLCKNYTYKLKYYILGCQYFNFSEFVSSKEGLCFDFACFTKCVVLYCSELNGWNAKAYVCDLRLKTNKGHSYNFITYTDKNGNEIKYYTDMTSQIYKYNNNQSYNVFKSIGNNSFEEYVKLYDEKIMNFH